MKLICISTIDWSELWQRHQELMTTIAAHGWEVYFIENMGFRHLKLSDTRRLVRRLFRHFRIRGIRESMPESLPNDIGVVTPYVLPPGLRLFRWINRKWLLPRLASRLRAAGLDGVDVAIVYLPAWSTIDLLGLLQPKTVIYDCVANFKDHPDKPRDFKLIEQELLKIASVVTTDSDFLLQDMKTKHHSVRQFHHGVNIKLFERLMSRPMPSSYKTVGFFGTIDQRVDWDVIRALQGVGADVRLIGLMKAKPPVDIEVVGPFSPDKLVEYLGQCDALIIPYHATGFSSGIIPAKLYECLATGMPTLVSSLPYVQKYSDLLYVCHSPEDYVYTWRRLAETESQRLRNARWVMANQFGIEQLYPKLDRILHEALRAVE